MESTTAAAPESIEPLPSAVPRPAPSAGGEPLSLRRVLAAVALVAGSIWLDQITKRLAVEHLLGARPTELFFGLVRLTYAENTGAWGSLGAHWPNALKLLAFVLAPGALLLGVLVYLLCARAIRWSGVIAYALIVGGGLGNLVDRVRAGSVVDFLYVGIGRVGTNIFNVADVAVVAGVLLVLVTSRGAPPAQPASAPQIPS